ncbi:MAG: hypothetical protein ACPL1Y_06155 [Thermoplasmata archaeon]
MGADEKFYRLFGNGIATPAGICGLHALRESLGSLVRVKRVVLVSVYVNALPDLSE